MPGVPTDLRTAREVHTRFSNQIVASFDGVVGHGIGAAEEGSSPNPGQEAHVIVVYLEDADGLPQADYSVEGVEMRFVVTGAFEAQ